MTILTALLAIIGALALVYIGSRLLPMKVKIMTFIYCFFVAVYAILLTIGNPIPILIFIGGEAVVIRVIVIFMGF